MASKHQDLWLWAFLGLFGFYAARAVHKQLESIRVVSEITEDRNLVRREENRHGLLSSAPVLKVKTLAEFTQCPNVDVRSIATKLVALRSSHGRTFELLLEGIASRDPELRDKSLMCLQFIIPNPDKLPSCLYDTYVALFQCLRNLRPQCHAFESWYRDTPDTSPNDSNRHLARRKVPLFRATVLLGILLQKDSRDAIRAGFIQWLLDYPFGGDATLAWKQKIIADITANYYKDPTMDSIIAFAVSNEEIREQLLQHGLLGTEEENIRLSQFDDRPGFGWVIGPDGVVLVDSSIYSSRGPNSRRVREESMEEQALRRRRREAMVLGESGRPIERGDIIERPDTSRDEEEIEQDPEAATNEVQAGENTGARGWFEWDSWGPWLRS